MPSILPVILNMVMVTVTYYKVTNKKEKHDVLSLLKYHNKLNTMAL